MADTLLKTGNNDEHNLLPSETFEGKPFFLDYSINSNINSCEACLILWSALCKLYASEARCALAHNTFTSCWWAPEGNICTLAAVLDVVNFRFTVSAASRWKAPLTYKLMFPPGSPRLLRLTITPQRLKGLMSEIESSGPADDHLSEWQLKVWPLVISTFTNFSSVPAQVWTVGLCEICWNLSTVKH